MCEGQGPATYAAVTDYLSSLKVHGVKFGLDRLRPLVEALGHPERRYPVIHIAGTNGKGSVAAMLDAILHAAGRRTGLYTSPHLVKLGERVQVDRNPLTEVELIARTQELRPVVARLAAADPDNQPSFFEFMTAMAFLQFARRQVDIALIEVGLGGRLDATNVVLPEVAVITSIGLDHCEFLGDTLGEIAAEKAGIIKPGRPVVLGRMPEAAETVIRGIAAERGAPVAAVSTAFGGEPAGYPLTNLAGDYQRWNAATAALVCRQLPESWGVTDAVIARGLQQVNWPGRWQRISVGGRPVILDASHNPEGAAVLETNLRQLIAATGRKPVILTGALGEFRAQALLGVVSRCAQEIFLLVPNQPRASGYEVLEAWITPEFAGRVHRSTVAEVFPRRDCCAVGGPGDVVVVTGSIYLLGEVMERLDPGSGAGEGRLQDF